MDIVIKELKEQLAAAQAREKGLRDALELIGDTACGEASHQYIALTALAQPTDDTALRAALKAERERIAKHFGAALKAERERIAKHFEPRSYLGSGHQLAVEIRALGDQDV